MGLRLSAGVYAVATGIFTQGLAKGTQALEGGRQTYTLLCVQCHGSDGDAVAYADVLPLAGINRRYPADVIGARSGMFSGRILAGRRLDEMVQYMSELRGRKGFADPGWLMTPYLLERKAPYLHELRVLDVRSKEAYRAGHVTNAVSIDSEPCLASPEEASRWLGGLGVTPSMGVVVYDDSGGPLAACVWWRIRRAGHQYAAVLDGGWNRWQTEGRFTTSVVPRIEPKTYPSAHLSAASAGATETLLLELGLNGWNWRSTLDDSGFRSYGELLRLADSAGLRPGATLRVEGPQEELAHLALTLHLLGYSISYDPRNALVTVR